jgi:hypothetical protein
MQMLAIDYRMQPSFVLPQVLLSSVHKVSLAVGIDDRIDLA